MRFNKIIKKCTPVGFELIAMTLHAQIIRFRIYTHTKHIIHRSITKKCLIWGYQVDR